MVTRASMVRIRSKAAVRPFCRKIRLHEFCIAAVGFLSVALSLSFFVLNAPYASADRSSAVTSEKYSLDKKFKGHLPITELTEDEAIMHALNRLGYGPRPGDVERIRAMGLEKWIDQQLDPDAIDDSAFEARLQKYPTLK